MSNFNDSWLLKVGDYPIPLEMMAYKTYLASRNVQDSDSYRDANGKNHRNVLEHIVWKVEFMTPYLTEKQFRTLIDNIRANLLHPTETDVTLYYYNEWTDSYESGHFYMPGTLEFPRFNKNIYEPLRIAFIEY